MAKIVDKKEKKAEIIAAALRVLGRKGISETKIQDIAEEAGIGKGTIYLYFKNKAEILNSILEQHISSGDNTMGHVFSSSKPAEETIQMMLAGFTRSLDQREYPPGLQLEILAALLRNKEMGHLGPALVDFREKVTQLLQEIDKGDRKKNELESLSSALIALLHGVFILWNLDQEAFPIEKIVEDTTRFFIQSLKQAD